MRIVIGGVVQGEGGLGGEKEKILFWKCAHRKEEKQNSFFFPYQWMEQKKKKKKGGSTVGQTFPTDPFIVAHQHKDTQDSALCVCT